MNIETRVARLENQLKSSDPLEDARALVHVLLNAEPDITEIDIEMEAQKLADKGMGLSKLLVEIAAEGPPGPQPPKQLKEQRGKTTPLPETMTEFHSDEVDYEYSCS